MKKILTLICTLLCANVLFAQTRFWVGDIEYERTSTNPAEVKVYEANLSITTANIPETVTYNETTYSVTSIGEQAFGNCSSLTSLTIPNSVTSIGNKAFLGCSSLISLTIPNSVTSIRGGVFYNCSSLTSVTLSNNITELPSCGNFPYGSYGFFENCSSLTSIDIPNRVSSIGVEAFRNCSSLTSVTIPNSAYSISINNEAFYNCSSLTSVTCLRSIRLSFGNSVFDGTPNNKTLTILCGCESEYTDWQNATTWASIDCIVQIGSRFTIGDLTYEITSETEVKVYDANSSITTANIPETVTYQGTTYSVTSIGSSAFRDCSSLTSITIPNSVTYIGDYVFRDCSSLTSITIPNSVTSIGDEAFYNCSSLTSITIPNSVTSIGWHAFYGCSSLTSITIPNSVTSIGSYAFRDCSSLTSITIPNSVTSISIGYGAFYGCSSLTSITIPNSVTSIGDEAFYNCSSLTSVTIEMNNIPNLNNTGLNTASLQNLTLGENVTSIASGVFNNCSFLQNVTCLATNPPTIADNTVFPYPNIATLTVPCGTLEDYSSATSFWNMFFNGRISERGYNVEVSVNDETFGSVAIENNCSTATLTATANACYQFVGWNDGNTENPRIVTLSSDTTLTANFEEIVFDTTITATINAGEMYSEFGFNESEAGTYVQNLQTVNGCDSTITLILDVNSSLMDVVDTELSFFPNPTKSEITFSQAIEKVEVIDLTGKTIFTFSNAREINIESLPSGAYYLRLTNEDKAIMQKIIKE